jgi:hypothetical protein
MVTVRTAVTVLLVTVKFAVVDPAGTTTLEGTVATEVVLLPSVTDIPFTGAAPLRVTVPVDRLPPLTVDGFRAKDTSRGALTANR